MGFWGNLFQTNLFELCIYQATLAPIGILWFVGPLCQLLSKHLKNQQGPGAVRKLGWCQKKVFDIRMIPLSLSNLIPNKKLGD